MKSSLLDSDVGDTESIGLLYNMMDQCVHIKLTKMCHSWFTLPVSSLRVHTLPSFIDAIILPWFEFNLFPV